tara:strand:+ start:73753 stop:74910 length:1158 start_codon:yes stop_codon:yes gene_type:complete
MIWTVFLMNLQRLRHNRGELMLLFIVPVAFFSIFALIFGKGVGATTSKVKVVIVDQTQSAAAAAVADALINSQGLRIMRSEDRESILSDEAIEMVRSGGVSVAIELRDSAGSVQANLLADASDQVAPQLVSAIVTQAIVESSMRNRASGIRSGALTRLEPASTDPEPALTESAVEVIDVIGEGKSNPIVSMYAAGIAVMFLLFGATGGGGALLEERENQTLDRLLATQLTMDQLLLGKWFYMTTIGILQVVVMFIWAQVVFQVDVTSRLDGFVMMTVVTASAAASLGLLLATLCKTRGQLNGLSVIVVLTMSALGGSMVPRYVMSERMREIGKWTFNAWALDGYDKVFWRDLPVADLAPQLFVLMLTGVGFLLAARVLAIRWQTD